MGGVDVFDGETEGFEDGDFVVVFALGKLTEFGGDVVGGPAAFGDSDGLPMTIFGSFKSCLIIRSGGELG